MRCPLNTGKSGSVLAELLLGPQPAAGSAAPNYPPTLSDTESPSLGASQDHRSHLDARELAAIQDALGLLREMLTTSTPSLSVLQQESLLRLEVRLLFLWECLSPRSFPVSETHRALWLRRRVSSLFRDPRSNPHPFHGLLLRP